VGFHKNAIDTPALLIDLPSMEKNLGTMTRFFRGVNAKLRPHVKLHKGTPALTQLQVRDGVVGVTCAKLTEAEAVASAGISDILIANQVVGPCKIQRLVALAAHADVMVCVDDIENVKDLSQAARQKGVRLRVLVEVNIGNDRCGVPPGAPALRLARAIEASPGLIFSGLMGYDGHAAFVEDLSLREAKHREVNQLLVEARRYIERAGLAVETVSASGTISYKAAAQVDGITEIQAGSYLLMDTMLRDRGATEFECALTVLATVTSRAPWLATDDVAILDVGRKAMSLYYGMPEVKSPRGCEFISFSQEHARVRLDAAARHLKVADKVEILVRDANGTISMYDRFYAIRNDIVEAVWQIPTIGRAT